MKRVLLLCNALRERKGALILRKGALIGVGPRHSLLTQWFRFHLVQYKIDLVSSLGDFAVPATQFRLYLVCLRLGQDFFSLSATA